jgi:hypothetical protein
MRDFLDLPDDGSIAFVHEAHRLRGISRRDPTSESFEAYFKAFQILFESKYSRNQLVFLSEEPFLRELPKMECIKITRGKVDGCSWSQQEEAPSAMVSKEV